LTAVALPIQPNASAAGATARPGPPYPPADASAVLDAIVLGQIRAMERNGASDLLQRLVDVYEQSSKTLLEAAESALAQRDGPGLAQCMHTLNSSSASLGARRLARACAEIGALSGRAMLDDAKARWAALRLEYDSALAALRQFVPDAVAAAPLLPGN
jgi:HPt (histidine-containing phosphotransfer) domain-containing protein